jgi:hypothetical protein
VALLATVSAGVTISTNPTVVTLALPAGATAASLFAHVGTVTDESRFDRCPLRRWDDR